MNMNQKRVLFSNLPLILLFVVLSVPGLQSAAKAQIHSIEALQFGTDTASIVTDTDNPVFNTYTLGAPERLVVDVINTTPAFSERSFSINSGFSDVRIGLYADKTRFVFDALNKKLPQANVYVDGTEVVVDWSNTASQVSEQASARFVSLQKSPVMQSGAPAVVSEINFDLQGTESVLKVVFDGAIEKLKLIQPQSKDGILRFGVVNASVPRSLRRVIDASVFPSSVLQITPYSSIINGERNVMFAAKLKGDVEHTLSLNGGTLEFRCQNASFADPGALDSKVVVDFEPKSDLPVAASSQINQTIMQDVSSPSSSDYGVSRSDDATVSEVLESLSEQDAYDEEAEKIYTGEPVTLVFDDADIRKVMRLIGEISDLNLIVSEDVKGNISLRLQDVPWDQALDLILEIQELGMIQKGNVVRILPLKKIQDMKTERLRAKQEVERLEDTVTEVFGINYKDAESFEDVIEDILSNQGEVQVIEGSKKIMVNDIPAKLDEVREILAVLDEPLKQVMIEARIVEANTSDGLDLGINWGFSYQNDELGGLSTPTGGVGIENLDTVGIGLGGAFLLPSTIGTSGIGGEFTFGRLGFDDKVLNLRIAALEAAGQGRVVSAPKVLTLDGETATIEQGTSIPYQSTSDAGTTTEFEDATLSLEVTPEVNPDDTIILEITASNSTIGSTVATGAGSAPSIDTKEAETKLLLKNGETTVIGGIYVENELRNETGTPVLKDIPFLGHLFKSRSKSNTRSELLIFITPRIVN